MAQDTIKCYDSPSDVVKALAEDFIAFTNEEINRTETCVVGITGGTVINGLLELLNSPEYIERLNWERIFFVWTDERFLPQSHEDNLSRSMSSFRHQFHTLLYRLPQTEDKSQSIHK